MPLWTSASREIRGQILTLDPTSPIRDETSTLDPISPPAQVFGGAPITFSSALPGANVTPLAGGGLVLTWGDALSSQARAFVPTDSRPPT